MCLLTEAVFNYFYICTKTFTALELQGLFIHNLIMYKVRNHCDHTEFIFNMFAVTVGLLEDNIVADVHGFPKFLAETS